MRKKKRKNPRIRVGDMIQIKVGVWTQKYSLLEMKKDGYNQRYYITHKYGSFTRRMVRKVTDKKELAKALISLM